MSSQPSPAATGPEFAWELSTKHPVPTEVEFLAPAGAPDPPARSRRPRERNNVVAAVVLGLVLALGLGMGSWALLGRPWPAPGSPAGVPVIVGLQHEPTVAWTLALDNSSTEFAAVGEDRMAIFDSARPEAGVKLLSLVDGKRVWEAPLGDLAGGPDVQVWVRWLRGSGRLLVDAYSPSEPTKTILFLDERTGERQGKYQMAALSSIVSTDEGAPVLIAPDGELSSVSLLNSWDPADVRWSTTTGALVGDGAWRFTVADKELLVGQADFGVHRATTFCDAFALDSGTRPAWLTEGDCFLPVGQDVLIRDGDKGWTMKSRDGVVRWSRLADELVFGVVDGELYGIRSAGAGPQAAMRYDPATGQDLWKADVEFDSFATITRFAGQLLALASDEKSTVSRLDAGSGTIVSSVTLPTSYPMFLPGEGQILAVAASPSGVTVSAVPVEATKVSWSATYPEYSFGQQVGRYLLLRNTTDDVLAVLG